MVLCSDKLSGDVDFELIGDVSEALHTELNQLHTDVNADWIPGDAGGEFSFLFSSCLVHDEIVNA